MIEFTALAVAAHESPELETFVVVFAENEHGEGRRLELQRSLFVDDQDARLGMDTYCLVTETSACCYGGIVRWSLDELVLEIELDAKASNTLDADGGFKISLLPEGAAIARNELPRILGV